MKEILQEGSASPVQLRVGIDAALTVASQVAITVGNVMVPITLSCLLFWSCPATSFSHRRYCLPGDVARCVACCVCGATSSVVFSPRHYYHRAVVATALAGSYPARDNGRLHAPPMACSSSPRRRWRAPYRLLPAVALEASLQFPIHTRSTRMRAGSTLCPSLYEYVRMAIEDGRFRFLVKH